MSYYIYIDILDPGVTSYRIDADFYDVEEASMYWKSTLSKSSTIIDHIINNKTCDVEIRENGSEEWVKDLDINDVPRTYRKIIDTTEKSYYIIAVKSGRLDPRFMLSSIYWTGGFNLAMHFESPEAAYNYFNKIKGHIDGVETFAGQPKFFLYKVSYEEHNPEITYVKPLYRNLSSQNILVRYYIAAYCKTDKPDERPLKFLDLDHDEIDFMDFRPVTSWDNMDDAIDSYYRNMNSINLSLTSLIDEPSSTGDKIKGIEKVSVVLGVTDTEKVHTEYVHVLDF